MGPVKQSPIQRTVRTAHLSVLMTVHNFSTLSVVGVGPTASLCVCRRFLEGDRPKWSFLTKFARLSCCRNNRCWNAQKSSAMTSKICRKSYLAWKFPKRVGGLSPSRWGYICTETRDVKIVSSWKSIIVCLKSIFFSIIVLWRHGDGWLLKHTWLWWDLLRRPGGCWRDRPTNRLDTQTGHTACVGGWLLAIYSERAMKLYTAVLIDALWPPRTAWWAASLPSPLHHQWNRDR